MGLIRIIWLPNNRWFITELVNMPIEAVLRNVEPSSFKPFDFGFLEIPIQYTIPFAPPVKMFSNSRPKFLRFLYTLLVNPLVLFK